MASAETKDSKKSSLVSLEEIPQVVQDCQTFRNHALRYWWHSTVQAKPELIPEYQRKAEEYLRKERLAEQRKEWLEVEQLSAEEKVLHLRARVQELEARLKEEQAESRQAQRQALELQEELNTCRQEQQKRKYENYSAKQRARQRKRKAQDGAATPKDAPEAKRHQAKEFRPPEEDRGIRSVTPGANDDAIEQGLRELVGSDEPEGAS